MPKFLVITIIEFLEENERFKLTFDIAKHFSNDDKYIFTKACEVGNINLVKKLYRSVSMDDGFIKACQSNNLEIINFLKPYCFCKVYPKVSMENGHVDTAWMLSKNFKKVRPLLFYDALVKNLNITKFIQKKISFDYALYQAVIQNNISLVEKIVSFKVPTDIGIRPACIASSSKILNLLLPFITDRVSALKKIIRYKMHSFYNTVYVKGLENFGMTESIKHRNIKGYDYFVSQGGTAFNKCAAIVCKNRLNIEIVGFDYCKNCNSKYHF
jgi:hypothetical protein